MRGPLWLILVASSSFLVADLGINARAAYGSPRQYYSGYTRHSRLNYSYRTYYYKPTPTYSGYRHHYAIYYPSRPRYVYYYNPYKKQYWGRCPTNAAGKPQYSLLAAKDRKGSIDEIPEKAFPPMANVPPIPESTDGEKLDLPPDDLPPTAGPPAR